jgi:hypothetical protein
MKDSLEANPFSASSSTTVDCTGLVFNSSLWIKRFPDWAGGVAQAVAHLPSKHMALSSIPSSKKKKSFQVNLTDVLYFSFSLVRV